MTQGNATRGRCRVVICFQIHFPPSPPCFLHGQRTTAVGVPCPLAFDWFQLMENLSVRGKEGRGVRYLFPQLHPMTWPQSGCFLPFNASQLCTALFCGSGNLSLSLSRQTQGEQQLCSVSPGFLNCPLWLSHTPTLSLLLVSPFISKTSLNYPNLTVLFVPCQNPD